jgi:N-acetylmuramoyl-L-alanine amidase
LENRHVLNTSTAAPLRPLNNIAAPAVAVELASSSDNVAQIADASYQQQIAQSIAAGIVALRSRLPEVRP